MLSKLGTHTLLTHLREWPVVGFYAIGLCVFGCILWLCGSRYKTFRRQSRMLSTVPDQRYSTIASGLSKVLAVLSHPLEPAAVMLQAFCGYTELTSKEGIYQFWIGMQPFVVLHKASMVEALLTDSVNLTKTVEYNFLHPVLKQGLLTSSGRKWRERRKLITPAFHFRILESSLGIFNKHAHIMAEKVQQSLEKPFVDIVPLLTMCSLDIICESAMGINLGAQCASEHHYVKNLHALFRACMDRLNRPWLWWDVVYRLTRQSREFNAKAKHVNAFIKQVIRERKELMTLEQQSGDAEKLSQPFLDLLLTHHLKDPSFTEDDINEEVNTFMFAGHDTTAASTTYALFLLGLHPEVQKKVHDELDSVFGTDYKRPVVREDLTNMKYIECVIKESQRLYSTVPLFGRLLDEDLNIAQHTIPRGTTCIVFAQMLHRDPLYYPNPEVFDPSRFLAENNKGRHPFAFVPFSAGPRNCLGQKFAMMEEKVLLVTLLRRFTVKSLDTRDKLILVPQPILHPRSTAGGVRIKFTSRS